jgi:hypothetical protein
MHRSMVLAFTAMLGAAPVAAQVADSSPFRPLLLPAPTAVRSAAGAPGHGYWQNRADYVLEARLDTARQELAGSGTIRYTNNSPDTLPFLWLQLDQNIFAPGSINRLAPPPPLLFGGTPFDMAVKEPGGLVIDSLRTSMGPAATYLWDTMLRLDLPRPLAPGQSVDIIASWRFRIPVNGAARMGRDGSLYEIAWWYPRMAVYDDVNGWNTLPYIGAGEFYLPYGDYQVRITVPAGFIVGATGELANAEAVLTAAQRQRLARARATDEAVAVIAREEAGNPQRTRPTQIGNTTWVFTARQVRDFAFAAAPDFRWDAGRVDLGAAGVTLVHSLYRPGAANWEEGLRMARHAIRSFSARWAPYPYPQATVVEGPIQGMEYPMIVFVPADTSRHGLAWVLMHELGHEWFPMLVGSDERRHPWMDEGFNTFIDLYTVAEYFSGDPHADSVLGGPLSAYAANAVPGREVPMALPPTESRDVYWTAYQKPALMLRLLREEVLGADAFDRAFQEYIRRWQNRHPQPADFFRTIENVSGRDLDWFWRGWIYTTARLDQAVDSVVPGDSTTRVVVASRRELLMPVELRLTFSDGRSETRRIPIEMWNYGPRHAFSVPTTGRRLTAVEVDPRGVYPDLDRSNNVWGGPAPARPAAREAIAPPPAAAPATPSEAPVAEPRAVDGQAALAMMQADLRSLTMAQREHFERAGTYTRDVAALGFRPSEGVRITIGYANNRGWRAIARHDATRRVCTVQVGGGAVPAGTREGEVRCG